MQAPFRYNPSFPEKKSSEKIIQTISKNKTKKAFSSTSPVEFINDNNNYCTQRHKTYKNLLHMNCTYIVLGNINEPFHILWFHYGCFFGAQGELKLHSPSLFTCVMSPQTVLVIKNNEVLFIQINHLTGYKMVEKSPPTLRPYKVDLILGWINS